MSDRDKAGGLKPPMPPTREWALENATAYLEGRLSVVDFCRPLVALSGYYRDLPEGNLRSDDDVYEFIAQSWVRADRVLRGKNTERELRALIREWLPDLQ